MQPRYLVDTHIVVRWISDTKKVSKDQMRLLESCVLRNEPVGVSAISLLEIALLTGKKGRLREKRAGLLRLVETNPVFTILPLSLEIAAEMAAIDWNFSDPGDLTIVATARVHRLQLVTSDQRIIDSKLVPTIE